MSEIPGSAHNQKEAYTLPEAAEVGLRAWFLKEAAGLGGELGFQVPTRATVPQSFLKEIEFDTASAIKLVEESAELGTRSVHPALVDYFADQLRPYVSGLEAQISHIKGQSLIARPSPIDEVTHGHLSFAGVYKSYFPSKSYTREEHLLYGTASVLAGRFTKYGNRYYERHGIDSARPVGVMYMQPSFDLVKETPLLHGTAYIAGDHIRNEYLINPPMYATQRDPRVMIKRDGKVTLPDNNLELERSINFPNRIERMLEGLQSRFQTPLDMEYLLDQKGNILLVQLRKISSAHLQNWAQVPNISEDGNVHRSAIVDSVGVIEGRIRDLRKTTNAVKQIDWTNDIVVINHETKDGEGAEGFLDFLREHQPSGTRVVVDHGTSRVRDHLQYALVEDPSIEFVVQTSDPAITSILTDGAQVRLVSTGIAAEASLL